MEIRKIKMVEDGFLIYLERITDTPYVDYILIDTLCNVKNFESNLDLSHTGRITEFLKDLDNGILFVRDSELNIDISAFIIALRSYTEEVDSVTDPFFYYDKKEFHYRTVELLLAKCDTCLTQRDKRKIASYLLKKDLLDRAQEEGMINDCVTFFKDLARILNIPMVDGLYRSSYTYNGMGPVTTGYKDNFQYKSDVFRAYHPDRLCSIC